MRVKLDQFVPHVDADAAHRWWSDFEGGRADHRFVPLPTRRHIMARGQDSVMMEEETRLLGVPVFRERTQAWVAPREVRFSGRNPYATFEGRYTFRPDKDGTRIELDADLTMRPGLAWGAFAAKPLAEAILRADLRGHAKEMHRALRSR